MEKISALVLTALCKWEKFARYTRPLLGLSAAYRGGFMAAGWRDKSFKELASGLKAENQALDLHSIFDTRAPKAIGVYGVSLSSNYLRAC